MEHLNVDPVILPALPMKPAPGSRPIQWLTVFQLAFSLMAAFGAFSLAAILVALGFSSLLNQAGAGMGVTPYFLYAAGLALCGLLLLPSAFFALLRLLERPLPAYLSRSTAFWRMAMWVLVLLVLPVSLAVGGLAARNANISWLVLPVMHVLATGIPILWFVTIGLRDLPAGSPQRLWGLFGAGVALGPALILLVESFVLVAFIFVVIFYVASQPSLAADLAQLANRWRYAPPSQEELLNSMQPYLTNPLVVYSVFAFLAALVPLIEEILKPVGMAFLVGRSFTPAQGFAAGVLSGAGYALCESVFRVGTDADWLTIVVTRSGTGAIHILATGLVGLGLAYAWGEGRYLRLGVLMVTAMGVHGLWNAMSLLASAPALLPVGQTGVSVLIKFLENASPYGLVLETLVCIGLIGWINYKLKTRGELHGLDIAVGSNLPPSG